MKLPVRLKAVQPILWALLLAILLRIWAASLLPQDFDEPIYLQTGFDYAAALRSGDLDAVIDYQGVSEHPAFVKLLYGAGILVLGEQADWPTAFYASRAISAFFGVLAVAFLAIALDPLAGGMLAVHTLAIKYGSQVYLEAVPHAMTIAAILAFLRTDGKKPDRWLWLSAIGLGFGAASKYSYIPVILVVIAYLALVEKKARWSLLLGYAAVSLVAFLAADISLWHEPVNRLIDSLTFHLRYSQGAHVQESGYPWFQPLIWILTSSPAQWHPEVFFYYGFDAPITLLALAGIKREWRERRWLIVWLVAGMLFLFLWPTKWPQYALTVTPPLCIVGAETLRRAIRWIRETDAYWKYLGGMLPNPGKWFWYLLGGFVVFLGAIYLSAAIKLAVGKVGWTNLTAGDSGLPANAVHAILQLQDGRVLIGTDRGAALWSAPETADGDPEWMYYDPVSLGSSIVLSLAEDQDRRLWFGTSSGLVMIDGSERNSYHAPELGLADDRVVSLFAHPSGRIYAGTLTGASMWNGLRWTPIEPMTGRPAFAITGNDRDVWIGTTAGLGRLSLQDQDWTFFPTESPVISIELALDGIVWAGTTGSGLVSLNGNDLSYFDIQNSEIPFSTVTWVEEAEPGYLWIGTSRATSVGGAVSTFTGGQWHTFFTDNSGSSGAEPTALTVINDEEIWIGTLTRGIDIYQLRSSE